MMHYKAPVDVPACQKYAPCDGYIGGIPFNVSKAWKFLFTSDAFSMEKEIWKLHIE